MSSCFIKLSSLVMGMFIFRTELVVPLTLQGVELAEYLLNELVLNSYAN